MGRAGQLWAELAKLGVAEHWPKGNRFWYMTDVLN